MGEWDEEMGSMRARERERGPSGPGHGGEMEGGQLVSVRPSIRPQTETWREWKVMRHERGEGRRRRRGSIY